MFCKIHVILPNEQVGVKLRTGVGALVFPVYFLTLKLYLFRNKIKQRADTVK